MRPREHKGRYGPGGSSFGRTILLTLALATRAPLVGAENASVSTPPAPAAAGALPAFRDGAEVRNRLEEILLSPEYRHLPRPGQKVHKEGDWQWLQDLLDWLFGWIPSIGAPSGVLQMLAYLLAACVLGFFLYVILKAITQRASSRRREGRPAAEGEDEHTLLAAPPGDQPADRYIERARQLAAGGDLRGAIREVLLGAMSSVEHAGLIRHRRGLTNRDYLRALASRPEARRSLSAIVKIFEAVFFGRRRATSAGLDACLERYHEGFQGDGPGWSISEN